MFSLKGWISFAVALTVVAGLVYGTAQQVLRQDANDPQIQMAEDWANQVASGTDVTRLGLGSFIDPTQSLAPFGIVYNQDGSIANSSVSAPSTMMLPDGVFVSVNNAPGTEARFTWAPAGGGRFAAVVKKTSIADKTYYVLAGRNVREVELRENHIFNIVFAGWLVGLLAVFVVQHLHLARPLVTRLARRRG